MNKTEKLLEVFGKSAAFFDYLLCLIFRFRKLLDISSGIVTWEKVCFDFNFSHVPFLVDVFRVSVFSGIRSHYGYLNDVLSLLSTVANRFHNFK